MDKESRAFLLNGAKLNVFFNMREWTSQNRKHLHPYRNEKVMKGR